MSTTCRPLGAGGCTETCPRFLAADYADDGERTHDEGSSMPATTGPQLNWERIARSQIHKTRIEILDFIAEKGEASPNQISEELNIRLGNVAYHARVLREAGFLVLAYTVPARGAVEHFYRLATS